MTSGNQTRSTLFVLLVSIFVLGLVPSVLAQGKNPVILVPGLSGSELRHKDTNERIWYRTFKSKSEDLKLPISSDIAGIHDNLIPGDVLREVKLGVLPSVDVYGGFIRTMQMRGGYHEENWDTPSEDGYEDSLYIFSYDWRLDNVQNARRLVRKIEALKVTLKRPDLKFDVVAHSMGGLIARFAVMYGDADLPVEGKPRPNWYGAKLFDKIILMGTPNEGSTLALEEMAQGFSLGGLRIDLPFVQDTSRFTVFTIPSGYQLLPTPGSFRAFDEKLKPISVDLYDPQTWSKYGWNAIDDKDFATEFGADDRKNAAGYFAAALDRAKKLNEALSAANGESGGVDFFVLGADCKTALDAIIIYRDEKAGKWKTLFRPKSFTRSDGVKVSESDLKNIMLAPGDGIVARRSVLAATASGKTVFGTAISANSDEFVCEEHNRLAANPRVQDRILKILDGRLK
ncbi:hypothetical protein BH10ACI2_BH10ACI2_09360 [soil metagenome]